MDLDGTLTPTDLGWESLLALLQQRPASLWRLPLLALRGRAAAKRELATQAELDLEVLPLNEELLTRLRQEARHRPLILVTGSDQRLAEAVAARTGLFREVIGSDGQTNLVGPAKAEHLTQRFACFDYVGNSQADLPIWSRARRAWVVNGSPRLAARAKQRCEVAEILPGPGTGAKTWLRALRWHQWAKNSLVFLPLLAGQIGPGPAWGAALLAALALCLMASAGYLLNDLLDLQADRRHRSKHRRPLAAGRLGLAPGIAAAALLPLAGLGLGLAVSPALALTLLFYFAGTVSYSLWLKRHAPLDVFILAGLYGTRVVAGGIAAGIVVSNWLLSFTFFVFFSLALLKRHAELIQCRDPQAADLALANRGWRPGDTPFVLAAGLTSAVAATLLLMIYLHSPASATLYGQPHWLILVGITTLGWLTHLWFSSLRGQLDDDPLVFALRDRSSLALALASLLALLLAR